MKFFCEYCGARIDAEVDDCCPKCKAPYKKNKTFIELEKKKKEKEELAEQFVQNTYERIKGGQKMAKGVAVFVGIFIMIIFVLIFTQIFGIIKDENDVSKSSFNSVLEMYNGEKSGSSVKYLLEDVITKNKKYPKHSIYVIYEDYNTTNEEEIVSFKQTLDDWAKYEVYQDYDNKGYINKIKITKIK